MRKKRSDRTHILYQLVVGEDSYVGLTAKTNSTVNKSVQVRFVKHMSRARSENKPWPLYEAMRTHGPEAFEIYILETVRGKLQAHSRERELINELQPTLNLA
jgi:hypothetical protein